MPAVNVSSAQSTSHLTGHAHDPFIQQKSTKLVAALAAASGGTAVAGTSTGGAPTTAGTTGGAGASAATGGTSPATVSGGTGSTGTPSTTPSNSGGAGKPAPAGLTATESYRVQLAMTMPDGGVDTLDPLERLSVLPNAQQPLLVELGVLDGGKRVLFAVGPKAIVGGPGTCTPGPIDCEILSLAPDQIETLMAQTPSGVDNVAQFAVAGIDVDHHPSAAAARNAREQASEAGRKVLANLSLPALSLFEYKPDLGAVIDLRNLIVGGN